MQLTQIKKAMTACITILHFPLRHLQVWWYDISLESYKIQFIYWSICVVPVDLPSPSLRRFSKAVTLRLRRCLFLLSPFAALAALPNVISEKSNPDSSILKVKHTKLLYIHSRIHADTDQSSWIDRHCNDNRGQFLLTTNITWHHLSKMLDGHRKCHQHGNSCYKELTLDACW